MATQHDPYVIAVIVGFVVLVPFILVAPLGWAWRKISGAKVETARRAKPLHIVVILSYIGAMLFAAFYLPWLASILFLGAAVYSIMEIQSLPADEKKAINERLAEHNRKPWVRFMNWATLALVVWVVGRIVWDMLTK